MNVRSPYMISMLGHLAAFGLMLLLSLFSRPTILIGGVNIVMPAAGGGAEGSRPTSSREELPVTPSAPPEQTQPLPEPEPPVPVPEAENKRPQPEKVVPKEPETDGTLPPSKDVIVPSDRGEPQRSPRPAPAASAETGDVVDAGGGGGDGIGIEGGVLGEHAPWYLTQLRLKIAANWRPPAGIGRVGHATARLHFRLHPDGAITEVEVLDSSGSSLYDRAAMRSIYNAAPLPPLPEEVGTEAIGMTLTFRQRY